MNLRKIIKEELEANEFANLVELMHSKQTENIELALMLAQHDEEKFKKEFGYSVEDYSELFRKKLKKLMVKHDILEICRFLWEKPKLQYLFDIDGDEIVEILDEMPELEHFFENFDFTSINLTETQITMILMGSPNLAYHFDLDKLDNTNIAHILSTQPDMVDVLDIDKLTDSDIYGLFTGSIEDDEEKNVFFAKYLNLSLLDTFHVEEILKHQPYLKPYFDKLKKK